MNTSDHDHSTFREWLYLEPDGGLSAGQYSQLRQHLTVCEECRQEQHELRSLFRLVAESRISVGEGFRQQVMDSLPAAGWQARNPRSWVAALIAVVALTISAAVLIGANTADLVSAAPIAAIDAIWDLLASSALAGAGMLAASWKGLGVALQEVLGRSIWNWVAFGALVIGLDLLLIKVVLRQRAVASEETSERSDSRRR